MDRVFQLLERYGYPEAAAQWLRRRRGVTTVALALASWGMVAVMGRAIWRVLVT